MEKKSRTGDSVFLKLPRMFLIMKTVFISLVCTLNVQANVFSQHTKFDIAMKNVTVSEVLCYLEEISKYRFVYDSDAIDRMQRVDVEMKGTKLETVLESIFVKSGFSFVIEDGVVIIREAGKKQITAGILPQSRKITGRVRDHGGNPLPGVTVVLKGTSVGVVTDVDGHFKMDLPADHETVLVFSFVGMKTQEVYYKGEKELNVVMEEDVKQMDEVVVTGIFSKSKESYTGAVSVITEKELKSFGNRNILTTLRNIDPSFNILESNEWGSNPNRLPEVQIRGAANMPDVDQLQSDTKAELNTPLIIMDGFEITLERMMDLDDSEVETITLLKDASATAIYGSRGANGVIVITTKEPEPGKLRFSYTGSLNLEVPDLSDYDVLNAREALQTAERNVESAKSNIENVRQKLLVMTGWTYDAQPEICQVPAADVSRIQGMDPAADREKALENNYTLLVNKKKLKNAESGTTKESLQKTIADNEQKIGSALVTNYQNVLAAKLAYDQAAAELELARRDLQSMELQFQQGKPARTSLPLSSMIFRIRSWQ